MRQFVIRVLQINKNQHVFVDHIETIEQIYNPNTSGYNTTVRTHSGRVLHSDRSVAELLEELHNGTD